MSSEELAAGSKLPAEPDITGANFSTSKRECWHFPRGVEEHSLSPEESVHGLNQRRNSARTRWSQGWPCMCSNVTGS